MYLLTEWEGRTENIWLKYFLVLPDLTQSTSILSYDHFFDLEDVYLRAVVIQDLAGYFARRRTICQVCILVSLLVPSTRMESLQLK